MCNWGVTRTEGFGARHELLTCIVYAYVLMSNHVHLLIETGAVGISKIMQGIQCKSQGSDRA